ncbi:MAG: HAD-IA family hydrolase [Microthrixaceae bacterium]
MSAPRPTAPVAVVFDLDGVIRDWNDAEMADVEVAHGLAPGTILAVGFEPELGHAVMTGRIGYRSWMDTIRARVLAAHGDGAVGALDEWEANVGLVDVPMLEVLRAVRRHATVALLSNGTTRLRRDLQVLDLADEFDVIFNTAELGMAKPDPAVFRHVLRELEVRPDEALFIDDRLENVEGACSVGIDAHQHVDRATTIEFLVDRGVPVRLDERATVSADDDVPRPPRVRRTP